MREGVKPLPYGRISVPCLWSLISSLEPKTAFTLTLHNRSDI